MNFNDKIEFPDRSNDVLTIGELLIDMISLEYGDNTDCRQFEKFFGGSPANIAMNVSRLGIRSRIASMVGDDGFGKYLIRQLEAGEMNTSAIQVGDFATSMVVVTRSQGTPIPVFYRDADFQLQFTQELEDEIKNSRIVHFSCWPISRHPSRDTIEKVITVAKKNGVLVCFDPNYHPMIWEKDDDGIAYIQSIISQVDIVKPSEDDAERMFGKDTCENQIKKFLNLGVKLVIMTLGKDGAVISNGKEIVRLNTMATEVVDTTGAGDAFWSGFYTGIVKGCSVRYALDLGSAVAAYKLKFAGAVVALPEMEEIKRLYHL